MNKNNIDIGSLVTFPGDIYKTIGVIVNYNISKNHCDIIWFNLSNSNSMNIAKHTYNFIYKCIVLSK